MNGHAPNFFRAHRRVLVSTFLASWLLIGAGFVLYGLSVPPEYLSAATLKMAADGKTAAGLKDAFTALSENLDSDPVGRNVFAGLTEPERAEFLMPFEKKSASGPPVDAYRLLFNRHWSAADEAASTFKISFEHPNPQIAARVANLYAEECVALFRPQTGAVLQIISPAVPGTEPYEPKLMLLVSDGFILGLNLAAAVTFITGAIIHLRKRPGITGQN